MPKPKKTQTREFGTNQPVNPHHRTPQLNFKPPQCPPSSPCPPLSVARESLVVWWFVVIPTPPFLPTILEFGFFLFMRNPPIFCDFVARETKKLNGSRGGCCGHSVGPPVLSPTWWFLKEAWSDKRQRQRKFPLVGGTGHPCSKNKKKNTPGRLVFGAETFLPHLWVHPISLKNTPPRKIGLQRGTRKEECFLCYKNQRRKRKKELLNTSTAV